MGIFKNLAAAAARWIVNIICGWLILKGVITEEESIAWSPEMIVGMATVILTLVSALWRTITSWAFSKLALEAPANADPERIAQKVKQMPKRRRIKKAFEKPE